MNETYEIEDKALPLSKTKKVLQEARRIAIKAHKLAYMALYIREPIYTWRGEFVSIDGFKGVNLKRLKEITKYLEQLRQNA